VPLSTSNQPGVGVEMRSAFPVLKASNWQLPKTRNPLALLPFCFPSTWKNMDGFQKVFKNGNTKQAEEIGFFLCTV